VCCASAIPAETGFNCAMSSMLRCQTSVIKLHFGSKPLRALVTEVM
jgi:hypothetical protein